jgi:hypothetical protein
MPRLQEPLAAQFDLTPNHVDLAFRETMVDHDDDTIQPGGLSL